MENRQRWDSGPSTRRVELQENSRRFSYFAALGMMRLLGTFSVTKPQHTENSSGQRLCSSGCKCKKTWSLCMPSVNLEKTPSLLSRKIDGFSLFKFFWSFHIGVFVITGASRAVGGGHFWSGRATGLCSVDHNQFFIYKRKGNTGAGAQFPQLSQSALAETT